MKDPSVELIRGHRGFAAFWAGQTIAGTGHQVTILALPLISAVSLDAGPAAVGAVAAATTLPYLLFSLVLGHVLEGRNQKRVMIPADLAQAVLLLVIPVAWLLGWLSIPLLVVIAFLTGTAAVAFGISGFSYLPSLVDDRQLAAANRAVQGSRTVNEVAGPGLAGLLITWVGPPLVLVVDALGYLASALGVARSNPRRPHHQDRQQPYEQEDRHGGKKPTLITGLRILFGNPYLRALTIHAALFNFAEQIFILNLLIWAVQQQDVSSLAYGLALSAAGVGGLLGTVLALKLADRIGLGPAFVLSLGLSCGAPLLVALWPLEGVMLALTIAAIMFLSGIGLGNANVYSLTLRQQIIPDNQLARSAGAYTQLMYGSIPIGSALGGLIGATAGSRTGVILGGATMIVSAVPMLTRKVLTLRTL